MKKFIIILIVVSGAFNLTAQNYDARRLQASLAAATNDTLRLYILDSLTLTFSEQNLDTSLFYSDEEIQLARQLKLSLNEAYAMNSKAYALMNIGNYPRALQVLLSALPIAENEKNEQRVIMDRKWSLANFDTTNFTPTNFRLQILAWLHFNLGILYENVNNPERQFFHYTQTLQLGEKIGSLMIVGMVNMNLGRYYLSQNKPDSALLSEQKAYDITFRMNMLDFSGSLLLNMARVYLAMGEKQKAIDNFKIAIDLSQKENYIRGVIAGNLSLSSINMKDRNFDSGYYFANTALNKAIQLNLPDLLLRSYTAMSDYYTAVNNSDSIVKYQGLIIRFKDSLFNSTQARQFQNIDFDEAQRRQELETAQREFRSRLQKYMLIAGLAVFLFAVIILWRNNVNKQKAYSQLKEQKQETDFQKAKVEKTLEELKATQVQLIHSEKMASLGELTAGIAHEIQNPLNFVNNFSDINKELIEELKSQKSKLKNEEVEEILNDISANEEKINHHGKRADAIVKGMLQHSRTGSGQRELTDINTLCDEYLRLAYHGLRAKDKSFNANYEKDFDDSIGKINIVPQDIGRVVLNLINNAFYTVNEKTKNNTSNYQPTVIVKTSKNPPLGGRGAEIEIKVTDNGNGIPDAVKEKIFQPFFTTKPTGQGTGLGLSLSYDIIKAHGGELKLESKEGVGSTFIIQLPIA